MTLKLYFDFLSQPSRSLYLFLKANKIPFTECLVSVKKGEHLTEDYAKIHPFNKIPAIEDDGFKMIESVAIVRYLAEKFPVADHWYPTDSKKRARVDEYLEWQHNNIRLHGSMYFQTKVVLPFFSQQPVNEKRLRRYEKELEGSLNQIENIFLKKREFLAGDKITIADIWGICEVEQPKSIGYDVLTGHPRLIEWMAKVQGQLQPHYEDAHKDIRNALSIFKGKL